MTRTRRQAMPRLIPGSAAFACLLLAVTGLMACRGDGEGTLHEPGAGFSPVTSGPAAARGVAPAGAAASESPPALGDSLDLSDGIIVGAMCFAMDGEDLLFAAAGPAADTSAPAPLRVYRAMTDASGAMTGELAVFAEIAAEDWSVVDAPGVDHHQVDDYRIVGLHCNDYARQVVVLSEMHPAGGGYGTAVGTRIWLLDSDGAVLASTFVPADRGFGDPVAFSWAPDGTMALVLRSMSDVELWTLPDFLRLPIDVVLDSAAGGAGGHMVWSADSRYAALTAMPAPDSGSLAWIAIDDGAPRVLGRLELPGHPQAWFPPDEEGLAYAYTVGLPRPASRDDGDHADVRYETRFESVDLSVADAASSVTTTYAGALPGVLGEVLGPVSDGSGRLIVSEQYGALVELRFADATTPARPPDRVELGRPGRSPSAEAFRSDGLVAQALGPDYDGWGKRFEPRDRFRLVRVPGTASRSLRATPIAVARTHSTAPAATTTGIDRPMAPDEGMPSPLPGSVAGGGPSATGDVPVWDCAASRSGVGSVSRGRARDGQVERACLGW